MRKHSKLITISLAAVAVTAIACGSGAATDTADKAVTAGAPAADATTAAAKPAKPAGPATSFGDGTYEVGKEIVAGTYSATADKDAFGCYWERQKALDGEFDSIIANANGVPGAKMKVTIKKTDKGFKTAGCGTWKKS